VACKLLKDLARPERFEPHPSDPKFSPTHNHIEPDDNESAVLLLKETRPSLPFFVFLSHVETWMETLWRCVVADVPALITEKKESPFRKFKHPLKRKFLRAFAQIGMVGKAAEAAGIDRDYHYTG
jgi:hypothetical protein